MVKDMTEGKPGRLILEFAIPLLLGNLFQQFYSLVDTAIVGKFLGVDQLAAVGSTGSINFLIIGFCMGICSGFAIPIAQRFGAKDESGMRRCVANSAWVSVIFAVVLTIVTVLLCRNILQWMRTPENIIDDAWMYIVIIFAGIPVTILYNLTSAIIRAMGDSKTPVYFLVMSALLNIVLDLFCILVLKMGVAGAALATVISQAISGICCLVYMIPLRRSAALFCRARSIRSVPLRLQRLRPPGESVDFSSARLMRWVRRWRPGQGRIWARRSRSESVKDFGWQIFTESCMHLLHSVSWQLPVSIWRFCLWTGQTRS